MDIGMTRIDPRVVVVAVRHELASIVEIDSCTVTMTTPVHAVIEIWIQADAIEGSIRDAVECRLGFPFWIDLGMADGTYTIKSVRRAV